MKRGSASGTLNNPMMLLNDNLMPLTGTSIRRVDAGFSISVLGENALEVRSGRMIEGANEVGLLLALTFHVMTSGTRRLLVWQSDIPTRLI